MTSFSLSGPSVLTDSLGDVLGSLQNPVSPWAKNSLRDVLFSTSNGLFSRFFKFCHRISCMDRLRTFRKNACGFHLIETAMVKAVREKIQQLSKIKGFCEMSKEMTERNFPGSGKTCFTDLEGL